MKICFITLFLCLFTGSVFAQSVGEDYLSGGIKSLSKVQSVERAKRHPIISKRPAIDFFEGALLGNGGLGVVVTTRPDAVVLRFGHNDVWDIRINETTKCKTGTFQEVFEKVKAIPTTLRRLEDDKWYREYIDLMRTNYRYPYPIPFPCGSLILKFDRRKADLLGHRLNIDSGVCEIYFRIAKENVRLEIFADQTRDCLWMRMVNDSGLPTAAPFEDITLIPDPTTPKEFPKYSMGTSNDKSRVSFRQTLPFEEITETNPYKEKHPRDRAFRLSARINCNVNEGIRKDRRPLSRRIVSKPEFVLCAQLDQGLASEISIDHGRLPVHDWQTCRTALEMSRKEWEKFWKKSGVVIDDEILERTWYWNLYFLKCSLRPGVTCPGLFANWHYLEIGTAWHGDYHLNYNVQQPFWATFSCNHTDLNLPYVDMVYQILPISKQWAREYYNLRGAFFPHTAYPVEMNTMPYPLPHWGWEVFETPWAVQGLWWHYLYTMDKTFLKERAFTPIKDAVLFLVDYMKRPEAHGPQWGDDNYHIFPSVPPELYGLQPGFDKNYDTIADLTLTRHMFKAFMEACKVLGYEESEACLIRDIKEILNHFPEYPTAQSSRGKVFVSVKGEDPEIVYNVPVSLMTVFPGDEHGLHSPPEEYAIAVNTYRNQRNGGGNELVFLNVQAARLGILDLERFKWQIEYCLLPNGTCTDKALMGDKPQFVNPKIGIWFENFSLPVVINECMLQSYNGELRFFPNWQEGKEAEFRTLRAMGAFLVSAKWSQGKVRWIEVLSEAGETLRIISPWKSGAVCRSSAGEKILSGERFTIETKPGEFLQIIPNTTSNWRKIK